MATYVRGREQDSNAEGSEASISKLINADIVFIGSGPTGLWTAINAKLQNPSTNIVMYEKYQEYKRSHILRLDKQSFKGHVPDQALTAMVASFDKAIKTNDLEKALKDFALKLGIHIEYEKIQDMQALAQRHNKAAVIVGSDGSHSLVREQIFGDKKQFEYDLQHIVELKYHVRGHTTKLNGLRHGIPVMSFSKYFVSENVGKQKDGYTPVTVRFFVDEKTYQQLRGKDGGGAKFNNPYNLDDQKKIPKDLYKSISAWADWRSKIKGDQMVRARDNPDKGERITAINLAVYASEKFVKLEHGKHWALVGDAALGVPYFRALNAGLLSGTQLSKAICNHLNGASRVSAKASNESGPVEQSHLDQYEQYMQKRVASEKSNANNKDKGVNIAQRFVRKAVTDVRISHSKLIDRRDPAELSITIQEKIQRYLVDSVQGEDNEYLYHDIARYFADEKLTERSKAFPCVLNAAIKHVCAQQKISVLDRDFARHVNELKNKVYLNMYDKQLAIRQSRWKTAWLVTILGSFILPVISAIIVWSWYVHRRINEPLRSVELNRKQALGYFNKDKESGQTVSSIVQVLDNLEQKDALRHQSGKPKARRAYVALSDLRVDPSDIGNAIELGNCVQIIATNWNKQAQKTAAKMKAVKRELVKVKV